MRQPNEAGEIMVLMYHEITPHEPDNPWSRSIEGFKADLQLLYDNGYRLITTEDLFFKQDIHTPKGYTPVVLTFDDGYASNFSFVKDDQGNLVPKKDTAFDIMENFIEAHPDFGKGAVFYICGGEKLKPFEGEGSYQDRFEYLVAHGYEIGAHTVNHPHLDGLSKDELIHEMEETEAFIQRQLPQYNTHTFAYPYGVRPKPEYKDYVIHNEAEGTYHHAAALLGGGQKEHTANPLLKTYDYLSVPRVLGSQGKEGDLGWWVNYYNENPHLRYVSSGDSKTITVPVNQVANISEKALKEKALITY